MICQINGLFPPNFPVSCILTLFPMADHTHTKIHSVEQSNKQVSASIHDTDSFVPAKLELIWIILGYIISLLGASYFFYLAVAGFLAGVTVNKAKKTLKNGTTVKKYSQSSRAHGRNMMVLSVFCFVISFIIYYLDYTRQGK
jgi:hypothetical protein